MFDLDLQDNHHILLAKHGEEGTWLNIDTGVIDIDREGTPLDDRRINSGWLVIRGDKEIHRS